MSYLHLVPNAGQLAEHAAEIRERPDTLSKLKLSSLQAFYRQCKAHDWSYRWTDDPEVHHRGDAERDVLKKIANEFHGEHEAMYEAFRAHHVARDYGAAVIPPLPDEPGPRLAVSLAYCDYIAYRVRDALLAYDSERILGDIGQIKSDLHSTEGYFISPKKTIAITDRNGKRYRVIVEEET
jgi:hypothetical protein